MKSSDHNTPHPEISRPTAHGTSHPTALVTSRPEMALLGTFIHHQVVTFRPEMALPGTFLHMVRQVHGITLQVLEITHPETTGPHMADTTARPVP